MSDQTKPFVSFQNVVKKFGDFTAVDNVSLDIYQTELFCLLGGSGCGKSTLLRMLAGFEQPTSGKILIDGQDMENIQPYDRPTNMMFQSYALFPHMSVEKNIAFGLQQDKLERSVIKQRTEEVIEMVKLNQFAKRKPFQLSGGQQQRVALARALVKQPKVLLLDEPLGALDKKLREETQFELKQIQEKMGVTFVVVTHDQEEAMTLSSRIGVMEQGKIMRVGTPSEIYETPRSVFVADFIGSVNLLEGVVIEDETDQVRVKTDQIDAPIFIGHGASINLNNRVAVAIRPEKIRLSQKEIKSADNVAQGVIDEIAYMGNLTVYKVQLNSGYVLDVRLTNQYRHGETISVGEKVYATWEPSSPVVIRL